VRLLNDTEKMSPFIQSNPEAFWDRFVVIKNPFSIN